MCGRGRPAAEEERVDLERGAEAGGQGDRHQQRGPAGQGELRAARRLAPLEGGEQRLQRRIREQIRRNTTARFTLNISRRSSRNWTRSGCSNGA